MIVAIDFGEEKQLWKHKTWSLKHTEKLIAVRQIVNGQNFERLDK